ncbi:MAG: cold-shock DNA-binding protein family [Marmoricola sp.]|nr:cold-shock DNA-binding protein family [Marmoricola sp.]
MQSLRAGTGSQQVDEQKGSAVPTGKVKWYDAEKGFGFLSREDGDDVYVRSSSLPEGITTLKAGTRVEFGILSGRKGEQAHQVKVLDAPPSVAQNRREAQRKKPEEMVGIVEDLIRLLEGVEAGYRSGRRPDPKTAKPTAKLLRGLADELEL